MSAQVARPNWFQRGTALKTRYVIFLPALWAAGFFCPVAEANTLQVGPGRQYATPCAAIAVAAVGDEIDIATSGNYTGDVCQWSTDGLTLIGVGGGRAVINAGGKNSQGKAIWVISGNNTTVQNIEFTGAAVPDMNGAGIRAEGSNLTIRNCYFHDNQEGILTDGGNSTILIEFSEFYHNGAGDGFSHNLYIGNITKFIFRYNYSHGTVIGHLLKSRAAENDIYYNRLTDEATGTASYEIDLPNGGLSYVVGNLIEKGPQGQNNALVSYQEEGAASGNPDHELFVVNNTMVSDYGSQATFVVVDSSVTVPAVIENNIFQGTGTLTTQASAIKTTNFSGNALLASPTTYDYHLQAGSPAIDKGTTPGQGAGASLTPVWQYVHPLCAEGRVVAPSAIDIGAYEFNGGTGSPPTNAPPACGTSSPPAPIATLSPATLDFGNQVLNTTSASQQINVTNSGTAGLSISGISASGDFVQTNTCGSSLAAGATCVVNVTFTPTALNSRTGTVSIADNASGSPQTAGLSGTGVAATAAASLAPTNLNFGNQVVGSSSPAQAVKLSNSGSAVLNISSVTPSGDYSQTNNCGSSLATGANCTINVVFNPSGAGNRAGAISVTDDAPGSPQTVTLSGTGVTSAPSVGLNPTTLTYGGQLVGAGSTPQAVTLTNSGNAALDITSIIASGDFSQSNNCSASLGAGASCAINVTFKPIASGSRTGQLSVADNAGGTPQTVTLAGTGMDFSLATSPSSATVSAGQSATVNVVVMPVGGLSQPVSVACTGAPAGANCTVASPTVILNGTSQSSTTVNITTSANSLLPSNIRELDVPLPTFVIAATLFVFMLMVALLRMSTSSRRLVQCFAFMSLAALFTNGCAGLVKNSFLPRSGGTPSGSYVITITGTVSGVTHSSGFMLTVQ